MRGLRLVPRATAGATGDGLAEALASDFRQKSGIPIQSLSEFRHQSLSEFRPQSLSEFRHQSSEVGCAGSGKAHDLRAVSSQVQPQ
jgi:hypothetical protein